MQTEEEEMTHDEIIEMARFAGIRIDSFGFQGGFIEEFKAFAKLVAAKAFQDGYEKGVAVFNEAVWIEREACAKVIDDIEARCIAKDVDDPPLNIVAAAIRARGNA
jgi:hypothetical protein